MKKKIAVTLDSDLVAFLDKVARNNRSDYVNTLLRKHRQHILETQLISALKSEAEDADYQQEIELWDRVVGDGIDAEE
jgi:metal-responsive CopG/Arc/MetJ family transcriptional regulator